MNDIRYEAPNAGDEAFEETRNQQSQSQQQLTQQLHLVQQDNADALKFKRQRLLKLRQTAARRSAGMRLQARFSAVRAAAERAKGSRSQKLLATLKQRRPPEKQEKADKERQERHGEHPIHGEHTAHADHAHPHAQHEAGSQRRLDRLDRLDRDGGNGSGRQQQQQQQQHDEPRPPIVKVKLSKRISPSAIRSDLRHLADAHVDEPTRLEIQMRLAWTRTCLGFGSAQEPDVNARVTPVVLGSSLDLIAARLRHDALRDATRQTGLAGVKHQLQTVQDEPGFAPALPSGLSERQKDLNVLKPLFVLHGERPSTRPQLHLSVCRIRTLLFATGQTLDAAQVLRAERAARSARARKQALHANANRDANRDGDGQEMPGHAS